MIWIALLPFVAATAIAVCALGLAVGLVGISVRAMGGGDSIVHAGATIIRSTERLLPGRHGVYVYFINDERPAIKIGISADPHTRLATLQTGHPDELSLHRMVRCRNAAVARSVETDLHHRFARLRLNGEWFDLSNRDLRTATRLARRWRYR